MMLTLEKSPIADIRVLDARMHEEPLFRCLKDIPDDGALSRRIIVSRWSGQSADTGPQRADVADDYHTIGISMEKSHVRMSLSDSLLYEGTIEPGTVQISAPDQPVIMEIRGSYNWIHLHVGNDFLVKCQAMLRSSARHAPLPVESEPLFHDIVIYDLVRALVTMSESCTTTAPYGVESIVLAIVLRILGRNARSYDASAPRAKALISWRLKRVKEHVATHLAGPITLPDLAQAAGLTRMHFAAQFKAATGLRPREYVLQHRIARARKLLLESDLKLVDIALASGFQTQAHFTTVFKKLTLSTPYEWRCRERDRRTVPQHLPLVAPSMFAGQ